MSVPEVFEILSIIVVKSFPGFSFIRSTNITFRFTLNMSLNSSTFLGSNVTKNNLDWLWITFSKYSVFPASAISIAVTGKKKINLSVLLQSYLEFFILH